MFGFPRQKQQVDRIGDREMQCLHARYSLVQVAVEIGTQASQNIGITTEHWSSFWMATRYRQPLRLHMTRLQTISGIYISRSGSGRFATGHLATALGAWLCGAAWDAVRGAITPTGIR